MNSEEKAEAIANAERAGIDLSLIDANLALSVGERWQQHDAALELVSELRKARANYDAKLQSPAQTVG